MRKKDPFVQECLDKLSACPMEELEEVRSAWLRELDELGMDDQIKALCSAVVDVAMAKKAAGKAVVSNG